MLIFVLFRQTLWIIVGMSHCQWKSRVCCRGWSLWTLIVCCWADCCFCFIFTDVLLLLRLFLLQAKGDYPQGSHGWLLKWAVLYLLWHRVDMMISQLLLFLLDHHLPSHLCCNYDLKCCLMNLQVIKSNGSVRIDYNLFWLKLSWNILSRLSFLPPSPGQPLPPPVHYLGWVVVGFGWGSMSAT